MKEILISLGLTIFLGPGVGHLYLRKYKKAILLIGATLITALHLALRASKSFPAVSDLTSEKAMMFFQEFTRNNSKIMVYYDLVFAAIWAYALVDAFNIARESLPKKKNNPFENNNNDDN